MAESTMTESRGILAWLKENLNPTNIMNKLDLTPQKLFEMAVYFGVGFLTGYLLRKYGKFIIFLILAIVALFLLQQVGIIDIAVHMDKIYELFGMQPTAAEGSLFAGYWEWVKTHITLVVMFSIGFLIGLRVG